MSEYREQKTRDDQTGYAQLEDIETNAACMCKYWNRLCGEHKRKVCVRAGLCVNALDESLDKIMEEYHLDGANADDVFRGTAALFGDLAKSPKKLAKCQEALLTCREVTPVFALRLEDPDDLPKQKRKKASKAKKDEGRKLEI